jgi:hypothetical protein
MDNTATISACFDSVALIGAFATVSCALGTFAACSECGQVPSKAATIAAVHAGEPRVIGGECCSRDVTKKCTFTVAVGNSSWPAIGKYI